MQRAIRGQAGVQRFFNDQGRAFCLYVVLGVVRATDASRARRSTTCSPRSTIDPLDAADDHHAHDHRAVTTTTAPTTTTHRRRRTTDHRPPTTDAERPVSVLAGPFAIAAVLLAVGGALKAVRPHDTAQALAAVGLRFPRVRSRAGRGSRRRCGRSGHRRRRAPRRRTGALLRWSRLSYLAFAGFVVVALRSGAPISSCGCFGKVDTPPSVVHVVLDLAFAAVAAAAAVVGGVALPDVLARPAARWASRSCSSS